jgi:hypothetical protein
MRTLRDIRYNSHVSPGNSRRPQPGAISRVLLLALLLAFPAAAASDESTSPSSLVLLITLLAVTGLLSPPAVIRLIGVRDRKPDHCPRCLHDHVRLCHPHPFRDPVLGLFGLASYRCRSCKRRYFALQLDDPPQHLSVTKTRSRVESPTVVHFEPEAVVPEEPLNHVAPQPETRARRKRPKEGRTDGRTELLWIGAGTAAVALTVVGVVWVRVAGTPRTDHFPLTPIAATKTGGTPKVPAGAPVREFDLVVPEAGFVNAADGRRIRGVVRNTGKLPYRKIEVFFMTDDRNFQPLQMMSATVPTLDPGASVFFETGPVQPEAVRYQIKEVTGEKVGVPVGKMR